jgi:tetratricopeptide (TPR) repeat protein
MSLPSVFFRKPLCLHNMNAESFANLLKEYAHLYQLPMEELRTMVMQYPYCHNLQVLLQEKSELDQHPDREKNLGKAATYAIDRKHLYKRLKLMREQRSKPIAEAYHLGEDFLELKDLTAVQSDLEKIALGTYEDPSSSQTMAIDPAPPIAFDAPDKPDESLSNWNGSWEGTEEEIDLTEQLTSLFVPSSPNTPVEESPIEALPLPPLPNPSTPPAPTPIIPTPKKAFNSWGNTAQSSAIQQSMKQLLEAEEVEHSKNKHIGSVDSKNEVSKKAWQSIVDSDKMASETWAKLLLAQKQYHKAIEVYERLKLLFPEKDTFFAAQIELIKKSLS